MGRVERIQHLVLEVTKRNADVSEAGTVRELERECMDELIQFAKENIKFEIIETSRNTCSELSGILLADRQIDIENFTELWMLEDGSFIEMHRCENSDVGWSRTQHDGIVSPEESWAIAEMIGGVWISYSMVNDDEGMQIDAELKELQNRSQLLKAKKDRMKQTESQLERLYRVFRPLPLSPKRDEDDLLDPLMTPWLM